MVTSGGMWSMNRFTGLKPKKIEGYLLYVRGIKITEKIWKQLYTEPFGTRLRMA